MQYSIFLLVWLYLFSQQKLLFLRQTRSFHELYVFSNIQLKLGVPIRFQSISGFYPLFSNKCSGISQFSANGTPSISRKTHTPSIGLSFIHSWQFSVSICAWRNGNLNKKIDPFAFTWITSCQAIPQCQCYWNKALGAIILQKRWVFESYKGLRFIREINQLLFLLQNIASCLPPKLCKLRV